MHLLDLPSELLLLLLLRLDAADVSRAAAACRQLSAAARGSWKDRCIAEFGGARTDAFAGGSPPEGWKSYLRQRRAEFAAQLEAAWSSVCARLLDAYAPEAAGRAGFAAGVSRDVFRCRHSELDGRIAMRFVVWQVALRASTLAGLEGGDPSQPPAEELPMVLEIRAPFAAPFELEALNGRRYVPGPHSPLAVAKTTLGDRLFLWQTGQAVVAELPGYEPKPAAPSLSAFLALAAGAQPAKPPEAPDLTALLDPDPTPHGALLHLLHPTDHPFIYPYQIHPALLSSRTPESSVAARFILAHHLPHNPPTGLEIRQKFHVAVESVRIEPGGELATVRTRGEAHGNAEFLVLADTGIVVGAAGEGEAMELWPLAAGVLPPC